VRLELPRGEGDARYGVAANLLRAWRTEGVLRRESTPSMYLYEQQFSWAGKPYTRQGFIAGVRLEPFERRVVLPHEHTLSGPKEDRRKLLVATVIEVRWVEPEMKYASGPARARQSELELGAGHLRQDEAAQAVSAHQQHGFLQLDQRTTFSCQRRVWRHRQDFVGEVRDAGDRAAGPLRRDRPPDIGIAEHAQADALQLVEVAAGRKSACVREGLLARMAGVADD